MTMHRFGTFAGCALGLVAAMAVASCGGDSSSTGDAPDAAATGSSGSSGGSSGSSGSSGGSSGSSGSSGDAGLGDAAADAKADAGPPDPCGSAIFCEKFDSYAGVTAIADKQKLGPWSATLNAGATMKLDGTHKTSGANALHVHIDNAATAGGRLFANGAQPIFTTKPTHLYGRMMMYIDPNGTSVHWTFFGVDGTTEAGTPAAGANRNASYIMSSLPKNNVNTYSFVYGLAATPQDGFHDCSSQSATSMPSAWACVAFEMDSDTRKLRMYKDTATAPILSVDDHGAGCVAPTAVTSPWYGPAITEMFVGAWSFHAMNAPLDVWIDDLVVDTKPVACPEP
jgi:hypothetical protein